LIWAILTCASFTTALQYGTASILFFFFQECFFHKMMHTCKSLLHIGMFLSSRVLICGRWQGE
ncbi:hypothetical protein ACJX0J_036364, partial [Zea mays]